MGARSKENISYVISVLNEFAAFSGLKCNFSKMSVMPVGNNLEMDCIESGGWLYSEGYYPTWNVY